MTRRWPLLLVVASFLTSTLVSTAFAAGLTVSGGKLGVASYPKPTFYPRSLVTAACTDLVVCPTGGQAGIPSNGDTVTLVFQGVLNQSTMCSSWTTNVNRSDVAVSVTISNNNAPSTSNDYLTVDGCSSGLKFGGIDLGSTGYVTGSITYSTSTLTITNATTAPQIVLKFNGGSNGFNIASSTLNYSCDAALQSDGGASCGTSKARSTTAQQF